MTAWTLLSWSLCDSALRRRSRTQDIHTQPHAQARAHVNRHTRANQRIHANIWRSIQISDFIQTFYKKRNIICGKGDMKHMHDVTKSDQLKPWRRIQEPKMLNKHRQIRAGEFAQAQTRALT